MQKAPGRRLPSWLLPLSAVLFLLLCEWFFMRSLYGSDLLFGDEGDGRLTNLIAEHWYQVLCGKASPSALGMFWPASNTVAYSDMFLGFGAVHALLRFLGLNVYLAFKFTLLLVHAFGTLTCFYLLYKVLGVRPVWSVFGAAAFSFADTSFIGMMHPQLVAAWLLPLLAVFAVRFFQCFDSRKKRNLYALAFIAQLAVILYTAWYMAFFTVFFVLTLLVPVAVILLVRGTFGASVKRFFRALWPDLLGYLAFGALLVVPFVLLSLPVLRQSGGFTFADVDQYIPSFGDLFRPTPENWLLGRLAGDPAAMTPAKYEVTRGFSPVLLLVLAVSVVSLAVRVFRGRRQDTGEKAPGLSAPLVCLALAAAVLLDILLMVRFPGGFTFWRGIYRFFPGAKSIRAVARFLLFLSLPLSLLAAVAADRLKLGRFLPPVLLGLLLLLNVNTGSPAYWHEQEALSRIAAVAPPPAECRIFFLSHPSEEKAMPYVQTDAWEIAMAHGLKTVNGYSGQVPPGWGGLLDVTAPGYADAAKAWIRSHDLPDVWEYDQAANAWLPLTDYEDL